MQGLVIRTQSGFYTVQTENGRFICQLRGKLKKDRLQGDLITVGDWVRLTTLENQTGMIEEVENRRCMFSRMAPIPKKAQSDDTDATGTGLEGRYQQILIANPDQLVLVFSIAEPAPRFGMLDRFLVIAEKQDIPVLITVNKIDLANKDLAESQFSHYVELGYDVIYTSAFTKLGLKDLRNLLNGKISLFTGPSGVGKTTLLNAVQPGLGLKVRQVSQATTKGRHTTVVRELFPLDKGGYVADTPGLKALAFWDIEPEELDGYFPEIRNLVAKCQFNDCSHSHEPGCAVIGAVQEGKIHQDRYSSYLRMRFGEVE